MYSRQHCPALRHLVWVTLILASLGLANTTAHAQQVGNGERLRQRFVELDKNGDGKLSADEIPANARWRTLLDTNGDGSITLGEAQAAIAEGALQRNGKPGADAGARKPPLPRREWTIDGVQREATLAIIDAKTFASVKKAA